MRFLIYGAGVIGSVFGGRLAMSGHDVTMLARGRRTGQLRSHGVLLVNAGSGRRDVGHVDVIELLRPDDEYDCVIVAMQKTQVDEALPALRNNASRHMAFAVNTAAGHDAWADAIGAGRLMFAFPSAGGKRDPSTGEVAYFIGRGYQRIFQTTTVGEYASTGRVSSAAENLISAFRHAGIPAVYCADMDAWQKTHVATVTAIGNALYDFDCDNAALGRDRIAMRRMVRAIQEGYAALREVGIAAPMPPKLRLMELPAGLVAEVFGLIMRTDVGKTVMADHCSVAWREMAMLQGELDGVIAPAHAETPNMDALRAALIEAGDRGYGK